MVHTEKIVKDLEISYSGVFDLKEFLNIIKKYFERHSYSLSEKVYDTKTKDDAKITMMKWEFDRRLDDYNKGIVKLVIKINNYTENYLQGKKVVKGDITLKINAELNRDHEQKWKGSMTKKFFRSLYDQYIAVDRQDRVKDALKDLTEGFRKEVKKYFNI